MLEFIATAKANDFNRLLKAIKKDIEYRRKKQQTKKRRSTKR